MGVAGNTGGETFKGDVEPDGDAVVFEALAIAGPGESPAAEGGNSGAAAVGFADQLIEGGGLNLPEGGFAILFEDGGDGAVLFGFDALVEIDKAPADAVGQGGADGGLAAAHETDEIDAGGSFELEDQG